MLRGGRVQKRIGLVLASIHTGASKEFWSDLAILAKEHGDLLFVFPGGRLQCADEFEFLRNEIYSLANRQNLDGLVSWASALGGSVSITEVEKFHERFKDLPYVTYSLKRPGHPNVGFDSYGSMQVLVTHMIIRHGAKRLAFLRGPETHSGAEERYHAYRDTLSRYGIMVDGNLISSPCAWQDGRKALLELLDGHHLIPGRDFDTLVCSSDMMMFSAGKLLEERGVSIPQDLHLVGFNDTEESLLLRCPCTTVRMPVDEMASFSYHQLLGLLDNPQKDDDDIMLPAPLVIRHSCGCTDSLGGEENAKVRFSGNKEAFITWLEDVFHGYPVRNVVESADRQEFEKMLYEYLRNGGDTLLVEEALSWYDRYIIQRQSGLQSLLLRQKDLADRERFYEMRMLSRRINMLESALLCSRSITSIVAICASHLPELGIKGFYLVLLEQEGKRLVGGFNASGDVDIADIPEVKLLPDGISSTLEKGVYVVEPLFMENQSLGYVVLETDTYSGTLIEELRTSLSAAIKGTMLLDAANKAREVAERAQRARSEFFANISNGLRDPLEAIASLSEDGTRQKEIKVQLSKANHLLDLSLSQTGALELSEKTTVLQQGLPAVVIDRRLFDEVTTAIREVMEEEGGGCKTSIDATREGLCVVLQSTQPHWSASMNRQDPGFSLAERVVIGGGGTFTLVDNYVRMLLPWPTLQNLDVSHHKSGRTCAIVEKQFPTDLVDARDFLDVQNVIRNPKMLASYGTMLLDAKQVSFPMQLLLHAFEMDEHARKMSVMCLDCPEGFNSLSDALHAGFHGTNGAIFIDGDAIPDGLEKLAIPSDFIKLRQLDQFEMFAQQRKPALMVTMNVDPSRLSAIRSFSQVPILVICEKFNKEEVEKLAVIPKLIIANSCVCGSDQFITRMSSILNGEDVLPPLTGILVKRAVVYLDAHATGSISRWQLAEAINVSEDYLTRIFRKELGLSPWDYLNRYRIFLAVRLLRQTSLTINEVASESGFQDQAYFCRVFKKTIGVNPGKIRQSRV